MIIEIKNSDLGIAFQYEWVLAKFYLPGCGPCQAFNPSYFQQVFSVYPQLVVADVNVMENNTISQIYEVSSVPTLIWFYDGQLVEKINPATIDKLSQCYEKYLKPS